MARGRMLNNSISLSKKFDNLPSDTCRLLATWTISHLDKNGVFYGDPAIVRSYIFPRRADITEEQISQYLREMAEVGLIVLFQARGEVWQWWPGFADEQVGLRADRETTKLPQPPDEIPQDTGNLPDDSRKDAGKMPAEEKLREVKGSEDTKDAGASPDSLPHNLDGWLGFVQGGNGKKGGMQARLKVMIETLYPGRSPPEYGRIGAGAKRVGGASRLAHLIWQSQGYRVTGDVVSYCEQMHKGGGDERKEEGPVDAREATRRAVADRQREAIEHARRSNGGTA